MHRILYEILHDNKSDVIIIDNVETDNLAHAGRKNLKNNNTCFHGCTFENII